jgi:hypothetical protein
MTCIVGLGLYGRLWFGCDAAITSPELQGILTVPKLFRVGPYTIGVRGAFRVAQVLQYRFQPPDHNPEDVDDVVGHLATAFVDAVRKAVGEDQEAGNRFTDKYDLLVGYLGRIAHIDGDGTVFEHDEPGYAIGKGAQPARGALYALDGLDVAPEEIIRRSLVAAASCTQFVRPPFWVLGPDDERARQIEASHAGTPGSQPM